MLPFKVKNNPEKSGTLATDAIKEVSAQLKNSKEPDMAQQQRYSKMLLAENGVALQAEEDVKILKITPEEMIRGVIPRVVLDTNGIEYAFIMSLVDNKSTSSSNTFVQKLVGATTEGDASIGPMDALKILNSKDTLINMYTARHALLRYRANRRQARSFSLNVVYSPYRVCGASSLVFIKDVGPVVGVLQQINTNISANGEVAQQLAFSHISILNVINSVGTYADALDNYTDTLPDFEQEFTIDKVGYNVYTYLNGRRHDSSVNDFVKNLDPTNTYKTTVDQANMLKDYYYSQKNLVEVENFLHKLTWKRLATMGELMAFMTSDVRSASEFIDNNNGPKPFVKERQNTIKELFSTEFDNATIWKDPWLTN